MNFLELIVHYSEKMIMIHSRFFTAYDGWQWLSFSPLRRPGGGKVEGGDRGGQRSPRSFPLSQDSDC